MTRRVVARPMHSFATMCPSVDVSFVRLPRDPSVEAAIGRWVDRLDWDSEIEAAQISIDRAGWRRLAVRVQVIFAGGRTLSHGVSHADIYVAVATAFRELRKLLLGGAAGAAPVPGAGRALALSV